MNISHWITGWARFTPDKPALVFDNRPITYRRMAVAVERTARLLAAAGIGAGDRVAWLGYNSPEALYCLFACARLGAILVPLNWRLAAAEHGFILDHSGARLVLAEAGFTAQCEPLRAARPATGWLTDKAVDGWRDTGTLYEALPAGVAPDTGGYDAPLLLVYTSGTTGRPKGALLTQQALLWNAINSTHAHDLVSTDTVLTDLPLFHVGGLNIQTLPALHAGATVLLHRRFDPDRALADIARARPTVNLMVPATMKALIDNPAWARTDLTSLRCPMAGSSTIPTPLLAAFIDRGAPVGQIYGSTETAPIAIYLRSAKAAARMGSCGRPAVHCAARIVDDAGRDAAPGTPGEILVRGPNLMREYWQDPAATTARVTNGWFHTGDIGHTDDEGYFYVDDRKQDVIISGGENVYPAELENVLSECPDLAAWAVVGRPHPRWGEVPVAFVVPAAGRVPDPGAILARFEGRLARYKHPREIIVRETLPRNAMGKVLKYRLREAGGY